MKLNQTLKKQEIQINKCYLMEFQNTKIVLEKTIMKNIKAIEMMN